MSQTIGSASSSVASGVLFTIPALFIWEIYPTLAQLSLLAMAGGLIGVLAQEHGGAVAGALVVHDTDLETGRTERIDCTRFGSGAYSIPISVEQLSFETSAKFILAIETAGMFQRLVKHAYRMPAEAPRLAQSGQRVGRLARL